MEEELYRILEKIGLTTGEIKTYLALLEIGSSTVGNIITNSGVSASKIYNLLNKLMEKGLASMIIQDKTRYYSALDPDQLLVYLDEEQKKIDSQKKYINKILPLLKNKKNSVSTKPIVEVAKGEEGYKQFYKEVVDFALPNSYAELLIGEKYGRTLHHFWFDIHKRMADKGIKQFSIYEKSCWSTGDPRVHKRDKRKLFYPTILDETFLSKLPNIQTIGDCTLIGIPADDEIFSIIIRDERTTKTFKRLIYSLRKLSKTPDGYKNEKIPSDFQD